MQGVYCDRSSSLLFLVITIMVVAPPLSPQRLPIGHVSLWPDEKDFNQGFFWSLSCKESRLNCRHSSCLALLTLINHHIEDMAAGILACIFLFFFQQHKVTFFAKRDHGRLPLRWTGASVVYLVSHEGTTRSALCSGRVNSGSALVGTRSGAGNFP